MEETGIAEVVTVTKKPINLNKHGAEDPVYAIEAKMYLPPNKYLNDVFRVKISKPIDLARQVPSVISRNPAPTEHTTTHLSMLDVRGAIGRRRQPSVVRRRA